MNELEGMINVSELAQGSLVELAAMLKTAEYLKSELAKQIESGLVHVIS